jgi:hypothetical protein
MGINPNVELRILATANDQSTPTRNLYRNSAPECGLPRRAVLASNTPYLIRMVSNLSHTEHSLKLYNLFLMEKYVSLLFLEVIDDEKYSKNRD